MAKYIVKRVAMGIFSVFIVATLTFFIMNLVPGGPFVAEKSISKAAQQALAEKYGLDKPLGVQYLNYMNSLIHGDMGLSLKQRGRTVNQIIFSKLPVSALKILPHPPGPAPPRRSGCARRALRRHSAGLSVRV